jgi:hypothetical protein
LSFVDVKERNNIDAQLNKVLKENEDKQVFRKIMRKQMRVINSLRRKNKKKKKQTLLFPVNEKNDWVAEEIYDRNSRQFIPFSSSNQQKE